MFYFIDSAYAIRYSKPEKNIKISKKGDLIMQKLFKSSTVEALDAIENIGEDQVLTFSISGSGTVQAEVKLTSHPDAVWKVAQVCADGDVYSTLSGVRAFRFNQTAASGETIMEVTGANV